MGEGRATTHGGGEAIRGFDSALNTRRILETVHGRRRAMDHQ